LLIEGSFHISSCGRPYPDLWLANLTAGVLAERACSIYAPPTPAMLSDVCNLRPAPTESDAVIAATLLD